jgi:hypothetical protein
MRAVFLEIEPLPPEGSNLARVLNSGAGNDPREELSPEFQRVVSPFGGQ